ncbi:hypothetical protein Vafri_19720 [Volvox africanus]|uniref:Uncharacterized protein n=1 Tax=Volvox africanus TaxID=51714 RepID=A0A8J4F8X9_9CHLO|nr:hypothetical protein Vafri_19720 [Volvox africanus]
MGRSSEVRSDSPESAFQAHAPSPSCIRCRRPPAHKQEALADLTPGIPYRCPSWDCLTLPTTRLCSFLEEMGHELGLSRPGLKVLELGAGLGWLGMTLARNLTDSKLVVLTEQEEGGGLDWLRHNLALNAHLPGMEVVKAEACDWRHYYDYGRIQQTYTSSQPSQSPSGTGGIPHTHTQSQPRMEQFGLACVAESSSPPAEAHCLGGVRLLSEAEHEVGSDDCLKPLGSPVGGTEEFVGELDITGGDKGDGSASGRGGGGSSDAWLLSQRWDFIIGSDLVYNAVGTECLPRVMRALAGPETRILYCHTRHRFDTHDVEVWMYGECTVRRGPYRVEFSQVQRKAHIRGFYPQPCPIKPATPSALFPESPNRAASPFPSGCSSSPS